uniref:Uncharacterized protein n=1 Tax=Schistocephalus solidus TaxID=70667 RepID=A0A0X3PLY2_SCHSO
MMVAPPLPAGSIMMFLPCLSAVSAFFSLQDYVECLRWWFTAVPVLLLFVKCSSSVRIVDERKDSALARKSMSLESDGFYFNSLHRPFSSVVGRTMTQRFLTFCKRLVSP